MRGPGELVAALPVLLGFHPERSLIVVSTHGPGLRTVGVTLRADLPDPAGPDFPGGIAELCGTVASSLVGAAGPGPLGAAVVVVGGAVSSPVTGVSGSGLANADPSGAALSGADPSRADRSCAGPTCADPYGPGPDADAPGPAVTVLADAAAGALLAAGVGVVGTQVWAASTTAGSRWRCTAPCGCDGVVADADELPLTAAAVVAGAVVRSSRAEIVASLRTPDAGRLRRRHALFDRELEARAAGLDATASAAALEAALGATAAGTLVLDDATVLDLGIALQTPGVRDVALRECVGPSAAAAEQLWAALVRETPEPEAAEAAALLAVAALARGDGALANIAVDRARQAWPGHRLGEALADALGRGFGPAQVRAWLADGLS